MRDYDSIRTSSTLLGRVKNWEDEQAWQAFINTYEKMIRRLILQHGVTSDEATELTQQTLIEISKRIVDFEYDRSRGSFKSWILRLTQWRVINHLKRRRDPAFSLEAMTDGETGTPFDPPDMRSDPETWWEEEWREAMMNAAMQRLRHCIDPKQYQVFDVLVVRGWPMAKVKEFCGLNRPQIYLIKLRTLCKLQAIVRRMERVGF